APDRPDDARHRNGPTVAVDDGPGIVDIDAVERGGETVGIALAPLLAVTDDIEPGAFLIADGEDGGVVLRRFELIGSDQPQIVRAHARHLLGQLVAVDQPIRLRIGADQRSRKQHLTGHKIPGATPASALRPGSITDRSTTSWRENRAKL